MNRIECLFYNFLEKTPKIKNAVRDLYQISFSLLPAKSECNVPIRIFPNSFFGFHDKCPWNYNDTKLLSHFVSKEINCKSFGYTPIHIGYYDLRSENPHYVPIAITKSWNWQQGAMLQWVGNTNFIAFNDFAKAKNISRIFDCQGKQVQYLQRPLAAIDSEGRYGLSYSFERLRIGAPGYEYKFGDAPEEKSNYTFKDGLYLVDIHSSTSKLIIPLSDIVNFEFIESFKKSYHFFSHCQFSPVSDRFLFFHRWLQPNGYLATRLITSNIDGTNIWVVPTSDMVSHVYWFKPGFIIGYLKSNVFGSNYHLIEDNKGIIDIFSCKEFKSDGHPQTDSTCSFMVTDTYPDRHRIQKLFVYDINRRTTELLLALKVPFKYRNELRCDFHPRWNRSGTEISFDSAHRGFRCHCTIPFASNVTT